MKKIKILELTNFSAGICGVWQRVKQESLELSKRGYEIKIFSSDATKGCDSLASGKDKIGEIEIRRFPFKKIGGESFMFWDFENEALDFSPDIIIAHSYRHPHTAKALKIAEKLKKNGKKCRVFLVTHAPFVEKNITRSFLQKIIINFYDSFIAPIQINKFDKIIPITNWEIPYLLKLGVRKEKIVYIPNGVPNEFFNIKRKYGKGILFLGRIAPVKSLETLLMALKNTNLKLDILGPSEQDYKRKLVALIEKNNIRNATFIQPVYDLRKKIKIIDNHEIFVLPSKTEAMPQSLIEAMARGKIVISSSTPGGREIVTDRKNGFLFEAGNINQLSQLLKKIQKMSRKDKEKLEKAAIKTAEKFKWANLIVKLEMLIR